MAEGEWDGGRVWAEGMGWGLAERAGGEKRKEVFGSCWLDCEGWNVCRLAGKVGQTHRTGVLVAQELLLLSDDEDIT